MNGALTKALSWGVPIIAILMLALTLAPAQIWKPPVNDAVYKGFDPNLLFTTTGSGGSVVVSRSAIDIQAPPGADPTVLFATTLLPKVVASVDVTVLDNAAKEAFRMGFWTPWTNTGYFVLFGPAPDNLIQAGPLGAAAAGPGLFEGPVVDLRP